MIEWLLNLEEVFFNFLKSDTGRAILFGKLIFWVFILIFVMVMDIIVGVIETIENIKKKKEVN